MAHERVTQGADAFDVDLDVLTGLNRADARRSSGQDDITGQQGECLRHVGDQFRDTGDHVGGCAVLHQLTVQPGTDGQVLGVQVGLDPRPERAERVEAIPGDGA